MSELSDFIKQRQQEADSAATGTQLCDEWLAAIAALYKLIRQWMQDDIQQGILTITEYQVTRSETEPIGAYEATALKITTPIGLVQIEPVARLILGGVGRVDMKSVTGRYMLIRRSPTKEWVYYPETQENIQSLTKDLFIHLVKNLLV